MKIDMLVEARTNETNAESEEDRSELSFSKSPMAKTKMA